MIYSETLLVTRFAPGAGADTGLFEGLASSWTRDRHGDQIAPGAFGESIDALDNRDEAAGVAIIHQHSYRILVDTEELQKRHEEYFTT